jgi:hypothetical protein
LQTLCLCLALGHIVKKAVDLRLLIDQEPVKFGSHGFVLGLGVGQLGLQGRVIFKVTVNISLQIVVLGKEISDF